MYCGWLWTYSIIAGLLWSEPSSQLFYSLLVALNIWDFWWHHSFGLRESASSHFISRESTSRIFVPCISPASDASLEIKLCHRCKWVCDICPWQIPAGRRGSSKLRRYYCRQWKLNTLILSHASRDHQWQILVIIASCCKNVRQICSLVLPPPSNHCFTTAIAAWNLQTRRAKVDFAW